MKALVVGSGGAAVTKRRVCPCLYLDSGLLVDCGPGSLKNLLSLGVDLLSIDAVLITHYHADHVSDFVPLLWAMQLAGRKSKLKVLGPPGLKKFAYTMLSATHTPKGFFEYEVELVEISSAGGFVMEGVEAFPTKHSITNLAYRFFEEGCSLFYTGDTAYFEQLADFAKGCDVLLHEAVFLSADEWLAELTMHSTAAQAGKTARDASVEELLLFHFSPQHEHLEQRYIEEASQHFVGRVRACFDGLEVRL